MAARFWVPLTVTNVTDNGSGLVRITVGAGLATGKVTGETVVVAGVTGATGANGTFTITAVSSTTFDLNGSTFGGVYVNGGTVSGGTWNATNIGNWGTSSGTGSGAAVPVAADAVTFDASSGGQTVTVSSPNGAGVVTVTSITMGAFTGTLDFATNDNNVTLSTFSGTGTGVRTLNMGDGTWTITGTTGNVWDFSTVTNFTFAANASTLTFTGVITGGSKSFITGNKTYNIVSVVGGGTSAGWFLTTGNWGAASLAVSAISGFAENAGTITVSGTVTFTGTQAMRLLVTCSTLGSGAVVTVTGAMTADWAILKSVTATNPATATNSLDQGATTGWTITPPPVGGGIISG